jgi:hypothetical protein
MTAGVKAGASARAYGPARHQPVQRARTPIAAIAKFRPSSYQKKGATNRGSPR